METVNVKAKDIQINVNGTTLCFDDFGVGETPIIFIHGFPFNKSTWQPQMAFFQKTHRVIAYDIRGFGASLAGKEKASITLFADDLVRFMDALEIEKAIVCGLSMGGYILLNAMQRYPDRFKAIILADTQCIPDTEMVREKRSETILHIEANGLKMFADGFIKNVFTPHALDSKKEMVEATRKIMLDTPPETITGGLSALAERAEMCTLLKDLFIPTLIICGREDMVTPVSQSESMHVEIAHSVLRIIEKAGHLSNLEQPKMFNKAIEDFVLNLKENDPLSI
jgi:3-oxoadipate enol-lactonase